MQGAPAIADPAQAHAATSTCHDATGLGPVDKSPSCSQTRPQTMRHLDPHCASWSMNFCSTSAWLLQALEAVRTGARVSSHTVGLQSS